MNNVNLQKLLAEGYFQVGFYSDALNELEKLSSSAKAHPDVLLLRLNTFIAMRRWEDAAELGAECCEKWRTHGAFFLKTADAMMQLQSYGKALRALKAGPTALHATAEYHYAIARCACKEGHIMEAKSALSECFEIDQSFRQRANDDPLFD